ncbi:flagellar filament capping protein FliD [Paenibacillus daejeonensis]|uniref:flagellar filament capping protein FliD n=1 Tax=Paenibacillus daejeonensis TaxID=135193 RepID=UPI000366638A|nr:flagellar filament capping protein FliD [Paenibacillus daejeonensis]
MGMRVSGLVSGMNTDDIVAKLMSANRIPLQKMTQQKQTLEWQRDDYRSLNTKLMAFRDAAFNMKLQSNYLAKKITSTNEAAVSVTGTSSTNEGRYSIEINKLAKAASVTSGALGGSTVGAEKKLSELNLTQSTVLTIGGDKGSIGIEIKPEDTISDLVGRINGKSNMTGVKVSYDANMDKLFFVSSKTGQSSNITLHAQSTSETADVLKDVFKLSTTTAPPTAATSISGSIKFEQTTSVIDKDLTEPTELSVTVGNGEAIKVEIHSATTIGQVIDKLNQQLKQDNITAFLNNEGKLSLLNGSGSEIEFSAEENSNILDKLGLGDDIVSSPVTIKSFSTNGENAEVRFNGQSATYESNTFTIADMTFTAKQTTTAAVDVVVTQDVDAAFNAIKNFVDKYNELLDLVNTKTSEKRYRDFQPLTEEQKKEMNDDDIKRWEEKAKSGLLSNDQTLQNGMTDLRRLLSGPVSGIPDGQFRSLGDIGISSTLVANGMVSGSYLEKGKLYIDETKLKQALAENPDEVMNLFTADDRDPSSINGDGFATRLHTQTSALINKITSKAGATGMVEERYTMGKEMNRFDERIDRLTRRMEDLETRYYKQFSAMETYLNRMNAQSAWLAQQFSTGG